MKRIVLAAAVLMISAAPASAGPTDGYVGRWKTPVDGGVVEITRCGASLCGRLVTSDKIRRDPALTDAHNKDAALRTRPLAGVLLISGFAPSERGWTGGRIYNPADGQTYESAMVLKAPGVLQVKGCALVVICKSQTWVRGG